jgi:sugar phosphate permease
LFKQHWGGLLAGAAGVIGTFATFYLVTVFALAYATGPLGYARDTFLGIQLVANFFYAGGMIVAGIWSDRFAPEKVLIAGALLIGVVGLMFGPGLEGGMVTATATLCALMLALGLANGPLGAWMSHLFPVPVRYSGVSIAFNTGGLIGGAAVPVAAQLLVAAGHPLWVGVVLAVAGMCTLIGALFSRSYADAELAVVGP